MVGGFFSEMGNNKSAPQRHYMGFILKTNAIFFNFIDTTEYLAYGSLVFNESTSHSAMICAKIRGGVLVIT